MVLPTPFSPSTGQTHPDTTAVSTGLVIPPLKIIREDADPTTRVRAVGSATRLADGGGDGRHTSAGGLGNSEKMLLLGESGVGAYEFENREDGTVDGDEDREEGTPDVDVAEVSEV